ncbi:MAG: hypothetical protein ABIV21_02545 [Pyrinomonadaceae bacterium]
MFENLLPYLELIATALIAAQVGGLLAMSVVILVVYSRHRSMRHIALVASAHIILTGLVAGGVIYKIFYEGTPRAVGIILALIAFGLSDFGIWQVWHDRKSAKDMKSIEEFIKQQAINTERIDKLEGELLHLAGGAILPEGPVHIEGSISLIHATLEPNVPDTEKDA